jgi:FkbM family methyltransferase
MHDLQKYIKILSKQDRPVKFLISRLLKWVGIIRFMKIKKNGYSLLVQPSSISLALWINSTERSEDVDVIKMILRPGDSFYDVGANIGQLSIEAALAVGPSGMVTSFEAHPKTAHFFWNNVKLNGLTNIRIVQSAVGEKCGWLVFTDHNSDDQNSVSEGGTVHVPVLKLDTLSDGEKIHLLKIDIEGYELFAIKGASETLKNVDTIYFEAWDRHFEKYGYCFSDLHKLLVEMGFNIGKIDFNHKKISVLSTPNAIPDCINLLAWRDSAHVASRTGFKIN